MVAEERDESRRSEDFDPRFDPAFQRGYQPRPGERTQTRVRSDAPDSAYRRPSSMLPLDDGVVAAQQPVPLPRAGEPPASEGGDLLAPAGVTTEPAGSVGVLSRLEVNPRRNPFLLALWLVGAGFVVLGIVLYCVSVSTSYSGPTPSTDVGSLVFAQLGWMLAGPLITVGLITLVGLLFLTALAARRPSTPPDVDE